MRRPRAALSPLSLLSRHLVTTCQAAPRSTSTPLLRELHRQIRFHGPLTVAEYMRACLLHPTHGYYTTSPQIFDAAGDFTTSPQLSPVFSELIGVFLAHHLRGGSYQLVELGPGTGALLATAIPVLNKLGASPDGVTLVERSRRLRKKQQNALAGSTLPVQWVDTVDEVVGRGEGRRVFVMHEFLDALPVHVFQRDGLEWRERMVDVNGEEGLRFVLAGMATPGVALLEEFEKEGDVVEVGAEAVATAEKIAKVVKEEGGMGLIVDYGEDGGVGDSVRAFAKHEQVDVLERPGECDVTADVNFGQVRIGVGKVGGVEMRGPVSQREFLLRMGAAERFRVIARGVIAKASRDGEGDDVVDKKLEKLQADYDRLVGEEEMGSRYKVAAIVPENETELAGGL
eukprot:GFKZ01012771.1.p1 GENE.GFKZ01012771.1~~GFKZ01012771.1.p1  ORF type:complete len:399 (-),score=75.21 GFKZ01012771.1:1124-2320(-)